MIIRLGTQRGRYHLFIAYIDSNTRIMGHVFAYDIVRGM